MARSILLKQSQNLILGRLQDRLHGSLSCMKTDLDYIFLKLRSMKAPKIVGTDGGMNLKDGIDASGRRPTGKGGYHYSGKYGGNIDGYREQGLLMLSHEIVGTGGGMNLKGGADASGRKPAGKGVYHTGKIGANVNGYSHLITDSWDITTGPSRMLVTYTQYIVVDVAYFAMVGEDFYS
ncbi:hypothetical protein MKW98_004827 [Papaver atlanticum]|uniref:Photosystem II 10 kDa polypeptide, chloroplastic n=1 Tax=Papaver atlanticum TaxID=357466 RepID=A0AAD4SIS2_9MAGN|nr:hypothetical protein MKW98_004827 [Papaver atlanticum]